MLNKGGGGPQLDKDREGGSNQVLLFEYFFESTFFLLPRFS